jgi:hypothetical protein
MQYNTSMSKEDHSCQNYPKHQITHLLSLFVMNDKGTIDTTTTKNTQRVSLGASSNKVPQELYLNISFRPTPNKPANECLGTPC